MFEDIENYSPHISGYHLIMGRSDIYGREKRKKHSRGLFSRTSSAPRLSRTDGGGNDGPGIRDTFPLLLLPPEAAEETAAASLTTRTLISTPRTADAPTAQTAAADAASSVIADPSGREPRVPYPLLLPFFSYSLPPYPSSILRIQ